MKKTLLIATAITLTQGVMAQITQADEAAIGSSADMYLCDSNTVTLDAVTGTGVVWDYTNLAMYAGEMRMIEQLDATTTANASDFPSSVNAFAIEGLLSTYTSSTASANSSQGFVYTEATLGSVLAQWDTDEATIMTYPCAFGAIQTDNFSGSVVAGSFGTFPATGTVTTTYDGTGTINFPSAVSISGVDRVKTTTAAVIDGGLFGNINVTLTQYNYYDYATTNLPIFTLTNFVLSGGPFSSPLETQLVLSKYPGGIVGVEGNDAVEFAMYPNPATEELTITGEFNNAAVTIVNSVGQVVVAKTIVSGERVNVADLKAGMYSVKIEKDGFTTVKNLSIK